MTKHLSSILLIVTVLLSAGGLSWTTCDWSWFSRSGALVVLIGVLVQSRAIITRRRTFDIPFWKNQDTRRAIRDGSIAVVIGTIVWGFGDLLSTLAILCLHR